MIALVFCYLKVIREKTSYTLMAFSIFSAKIQTSLKFDFWRENSKEFVMIKSFSQRTHESLCQRGSKSALATRTVEEWPSRPMPLMALIF